MTTPVKLNLYTYEQLDTVITICANLMSRTVDQNIMPTLRKAIYRKYGKQTKEDIERAFELGLAGDLGLDIHHNSGFSINLFCKIINTYLSSPYYKKEEKIKEGLSKFEQAKKELWTKKLYDRTRQAYQDYLTTGKFEGDTFGSPMYDTLKKNQIGLNTQEIDEIRKAVKDKIQTGKIKLRGMKKLSEVVTMINGSSEMEFMVQREAVKFCFENLKKKNVKSILT